MLCLRVRLAVALVVLLPLRAMPQRADSANATPAPPRGVVVGSPQEDWLRMSQLVAGAGSAGTLIRAATPAMSGESTRLEFTWIPPAVDLTWNSALAFSLNDGSQWTGRGLTASATAGVEARRGRIHVRFQPQIWRTENQPFSTLPGGDPGRDAFASPWHAGLVSADLPQRFGHEPITAIELGESAAWVTTSGLAIGLSSESQWWGPGIRNALLMSNNAGGIPHVFVRTIAPFKTAAGAFEARWIVGGLVESRFFDDRAANDLRSLSGAVASFTPVLDSNVTIGMSRVVYASIPGAGALPARALDVFGRWGQGFNVRWAKNGRAAEQLISFFGRWVLPNSNAEVYSEWGRVLLPTTVKALLVAPQHTQGFTVGGQWMPQLGERGRLRVQFELTNLEQSPESREADTLSFYASSVVPQGYTHRGQVVGASVGPGSSSQWLALDYLMRNHGIGAFAGRIRWDTDAYYRQATSVLYFAHDVTLLGGVRFSTQALGRGVATEIAWQHRYNYLFQNSVDGFSRDGAFDVSNVSMRLRVY